MTPREGWAAPILWDGLLAGGGTAEQCGWLRDRHGVSWQVVPGAMGR